MTSLPMNVPFWAEVLTAVLLIASSLFTLT